MIVLVAVAGVLALAVTFALAWRSDRKKQAEWDALDKAEQDRLRAIWHAQAELDSREVW